MEYPADGIIRLRVAVRGAVQGVGFRPFIFRLATGLGLKGWVRNSSQGAVVEVEGRGGTLRDFLLRIEPEKPPRCFIQSLEPAYLDPAGYGDFAILPSDASGGKTAVVLPDIAVCADCLREILDPADRRYRYPFTNCTNCGPRFSIVESLPYDRANTAMKAFAMCRRCQAEYDNPLDRRFHAQPNACPECGPHLELWDRRGNVLAQRERALMDAAGALRGGAILAVKGIGGFHLMADARNGESVRELRRRKRREEKPLAVMFPSLLSAKAICEVSPLEERLLRSPEAPIVLLQRKKTSADTAGIAGAAAPGNPCLGAMLPYSPLHCLLLGELGFPVVATSGNLSDETICVDEGEALVRLGGVADLFLAHDRPIARPVDDSVVRVVLDRELALRRARGYAPLPVSMRGPLPPLIALGGHLKNTIAVSAGNQAFVSQHIGDLESAQGYDTFKSAAANFPELFGYDTLWMSGNGDGRRAGRGEGDGGGISPLVVAYDAHPDYVSTRFALEAVKAADGANGVSLVAVQHHHAHALSCMAENDLAGPALAAVWDGSGYGLDGTVWGGEFLSVFDGGFRRVGRLRTFRLPGGEKAVREPRRAALGLLYEIYGDAAFSMADVPSVRDFSPGELEILKTLLKNKVNSPATSSAGRLFDAVASLLNVRHRSGFEGQAAMELEYALGDVHADGRYAFAISEQDGLLSADWSPMIEEILGDVRNGEPLSGTSRKFHNALAETVVAVVRRAGEPRVVLSGGCFQNKYLTERTVLRLREEGFRPYWHQRIPPNDGGISLGQAVAVGARPEGV
ncbi:MAG: carbamoyltransferase HypF [Nitrospinae bacterium]|nr:carbamoyltransferase HypF [Nitrospinota bacterium]